ncbi:hypothetical protein CALVIDRAFT_602557 [Calocera viscosa TUFC12733]|uniref:Altered inheritance of mitochondria protein 9, mitochondrial n=1 Tax=Calocera viscosa (strain TUFC12733) TaxID=1330018 RepID=A0A167GUM8_CALVF|nr:hypothetical protein CALVIDRAFT_602557 [Calocera viscosa TUFC12733]
MLHDLQPVLMGPAAINPVHVKSTVRWLRKDEQNRAERRLVLDVSALWRTSAEKIRSKCRSLRIRSEGASSAIFELSFENGKNAIAKVAYADRKEMKATIQSEVATMQWAREMCGVPTPKVLRWCAEAEKSDIGAAYILMEEVRGITLDEAASEGPIPETTFASIADYQTQLARTRFNMIGSLHLKEDLPQDLQTRSLFAEGNTHKPPVAGSELKFALGPSVHRVFGRLIQEDILAGEANTGPWRDINSYLDAILFTERAMIPVYGTDSQSEDPIDRLYREGDLDRLLAQFESAKSYLLPPAEYEGVFVLQHPDLHASNVLVDPISKAVTGILDWEHATIAPISYQCGFPPLMKALHETSTGGQKDGESESRARSMEATTSECKDDGCQDTAIEKDSEEEEGDLHDEAAHLAYLSLIPEDNIVYGVIQDNLRRRTSGDPLHMFEGSKGYNLSRCREQWIILLANNDSLAKVCNYGYEDYEADRKGVLEFHDALTAEEHIAQRLQIDIDLDGRCDNQEEYTEKCNLAKALLREGEAAVVKWWPFTDLCT